MQTSPDYHTLIRIGTRGSALALAQAHETRARLMAAHDLPEEAFEIVVIKTTGDMVLDRPLSEIGGKGLFTKEIEEALYDGRIDLAVHSSKDMPTVLPDGLAITAFLPREDVRDAFISEHWSSLADLPEGAVVGTASLRRQALVKRLRPDLEVVTFRGNVQTRMEKLRRGDVAATLLANAGLRRLGMEAEITDLLDEDSFPPAIGQGAICIESREDDQRVLSLLAPIHHVETEAALLMERAFLRTLDGSCRTPIAGRAIVDGDTITFRGMILTPDGREVLETRREGALAEAEVMGRDAGEELKVKAGPQFMAEVLGHG